MSNTMLFVLLSVVVLVNAYFTYRRTEGIDAAGRKLLAASQLLYLVFILIIFGLGKIMKTLGIAGMMQKNGSSMPVFIGSILFVVAIFAGFMFIKKRIEDKIREDHAE